ncbi:MAG: hypothetical protein M1822_002171 [Bathelium mastoideum]|nr:MAG: hypothetical protein M1822_002171 [Bathelium mastoideum]
MRSTHLVPCIFVFQFLGVSPTATGRYELRPRQDHGSSSTLTSATSATASDAASSTALASTLTSSIKPSSSTPPSISSSIPLSSSNAAGASSAVSDASASTVTFASTPTTSVGASPSDQAKGQLPLPPIITPAVGITGAVLLVTGIVYCLIGIKHRALYIFLAPAFLVSLAVTVLVEYVDSPPVSNAVQGAYFVAATVAGCIFGALSLIFSEVTEGLGCLLGGFCLSMWFLVLKPGGLLTTTVSRAIFIGVFSAVGFSLSFSQYTRTYGLIGCIAFAGATITVLGIDCFSRAGLKEFWLYIWNLNSQLFPLNTNTYPITRGIKVEIAGIIILCLLGLISQLKVWKLVKERRERKEFAQLEQERQREEYEAHLGQQIEQHNAKARKQWEKIYGDRMSTKNEHPDSGIGSSGNSYYQTSSVKDLQRSQQNSIELSDVPGSTYASSSDLVPKGIGKDSNPRVSVRALSDDEIRQIDGHGNSIQRPPAIQEEAVGSTSSLSSSQFQRSSVSLKGKSLRPSLPPPSLVVPLPFEVQPSEDASDDGLDPAEAHGRDRLRNDRLSQLSLANRFSTAASLGDELDVPHMEDGHRSSLAATLSEKLGNDDTLPELSPFVTPLKTEFGDEAENVPEVVTETKSERAVTLNSSGGLKPTNVMPRSKSDTDLSGVSLGQKMPEKIQQVPPVDPAVMQAASASLTSSTRPKEGELSHSEQGADSTRKTVAASQGTTTTVAAALTKQLPDKLSRVALSYRTNEWAKHLDAADEPEDQPESRPSTPGVTVEIRALESTAPTKATAFEEKVTEHKRPAIVERISLGSSNMPRLSRTTPIYASQASSSTSLMRNGSTNGVYNINTIQRNASQSSMRQAPTSSQPSSQTKPSIKGNRSSSMPLTVQPLEESRIEEEATALPASAFSRLNSSRGALLGIAEKKLQERTSSALLGRQSSLPNVGVAVPSNSSSSNENVTYAQDEDDIPLSQRKSMIQAQRKSSAPALQQSTVYDSHQPKRASTVDARKQAANLALWRDSIRSDMAQKVPRIAEEEEARTHMIMQRQNSQLKQEQQAAAAQHRESMFDDMMRRGNMLDLHREKMRKMQAKANRHAS